MGEAFCLDSVSLIESPSEAATKVDALLENNDAPRRIETAQSSALRDVNNGQGVKLIASEMAEVAELAQVVGRRIPFPYTLQ